VNDASHAETAGGHRLFDVVNGEAGGRVLIICDHASRVVPAELDNLGLEETLLYRHIAWDIGAADVARRLAGLLDAPAVLCGTSRLVIDCNRLHDDPTLIPPVSDGIAVPGNENIDDDERRRRIDTYFRPYHEEIDRRLRAIEAAGHLPVIVSVHSFTPVMNGFERPWHVGLLWHEDDRLARAAIVELRRNPTLVVGENEPYTGWEPLGYALHVHSDTAGRPSCVFEVRQDLIDTHHGAEEWAHKLAAALRPILTDESLARVLG
jgi:predicted N-formylglutamate amidohydrolase